MSSPVTEAAIRTGPALAEAHGLSASLGAIVMEARALSGALLPGLHGLRCEGRGETYWQHREMRDGESLRVVDWRRSARSDRLFVREREQENPARLQLWADVRASMCWTGSETRQTKVHAGLVLALGLGLAVADAGESVMALGRSPSRLSGDLAAAILAAGAAEPLAGVAGTIVLISDGLEEPALWHRRILALRAARAQVLVVLLADPAEADFPYRGRLKVSAPGAANELFQVGRAEAARDAYGALYQAHMAAVRAAIVEAGGQVLNHATDRPATAVGLQLATLISKSARNQTGNN